MMHRPTGSSSNTGISILPLFGKRKRPRQALYAQPSSISQETNTAPAQATFQQDRDGYPSGMNNASSGGGRFISNQMINHAPGGWNKIPPPRKDQQSLGTAIQPSVLSQTKTRAWGNNFQESSQSHPQNIKKLRQPSTVSKLLPNTSPAANSFQRPPQTPFLSRQSSTNIKLHQPRAFTPLQNQPVRPQQNPSWQLRTQSQVNQASTTKIPNVQIIPDLKGKMSQTKTGMMVLSVGVEGVKKWSQILEADDIIMFEVFGILNSALTTDDTGTAKRFTLKDGNQTLSCIFYETDRRIPCLTRGQWLRCIGTFHANNSTFQCISLRIASSGEQRWMKAMMGACEKVLRSKMVVIKKEP